MTYKSYRLLDDLYHRDTKQSEKYNVRSTTKSPCVQCSYINNPTPALEFSSYKTELPSTPILPFGGGTTLGSVTKYKPLSACGGLQCILSVLKRLHSKGE